MSTITKTPLGKLQTGDVVHFTTALPFGGDIRPRGTSITLTPQLIEGTIDRLGNSWLDEVDEPGSRIGRGPWPTDEPRWVYGSPDWSEEREAARRRAWAVIDPEERAAARAEVERVYGPAEATSRTLSAPKSSPQERAAEEQRRRLDSEGARAKSSYSPQRREV